MIPPAIIKMRFKESGKKGWALWIPLFLLWPIMLLVMIPVFLVSVFVDVVLFVIGRPYHHYTLLLIWLGQLLSDLRGMRMDIEGETTVHVTVS